MNIDYKDYQLAKTSRQHEAIEWAIYYHYNTADTVNPRLFLIGDSICNGYQGAVRNELANDANVSFWAGSKCVTDPDYLRELDFHLDSYRYDLISFNNGLHSLQSDPAEYGEAFGKVIRFIRMKCPAAKLVITTSTPCASAEKTAAVCVLNRTAKRIAAENGLEVLDLFAHMDPLDRQENWRDECHYHADAIQLQGRIIADFFRERFSGSGNVIQQGTEFGPDGVIDAVQQNEKLSSVRYRPKSGTLEAVALDRKNVPEKTGIA